MKKRTLPTRATRQIPLITLGAMFALTGCGGGGGSSTPPNPLPTGVTQHSVTNYSATAVGAGNTAATQDLLTGGLGRAGLQAGVAAPTFADPANPTALELRRNAIQANYRGLVDVLPNGGYGTLYGPNVAADGTVTTNAGLIPGREYYASYEDGSSTNRTIMAVQIPDSFDQANPCLVLGPSSGSRGVYGAIGTSAEWALKRGCAVVLTDAGKGPGYHDLMDDSVNRVDGPIATRTAAGALTYFAAAVTDAARTAFNAVTPNRFAFKHAHSQQNPEKDWGNHTLRAAQYALYAMNDRFGTPNNQTPFSAANTLVIAGSVSNGGAAVMRAAEADTAGLIDGVVAGEPVTQMPTSTGYAVNFAGAPVASQGRHLADYVTFANIYQPCAARATAAQPAGGGQIDFLTVGALNVRADNRCTSLAEKGLVTGATLAAQSDDALARLRAHGYGAESDILHNSHYAVGGTTANLASFYPLAYGRFSVLENICATSFANTNATGDVVAATAAGKAALFATGNGTAAGPANPVYNASVGGAKYVLFGTSPSTARLDLSLDQALCMRALVTGTDPVTGTALGAATTPTAAQSASVRAGMAETTVTGNLRGKPALVVAGRDDTLIPINHNARAYAAYNRATEGASSKLRYVEVTNAQHFDTFLGLSGYDTRYVPLHYYFNRAMDAMYAHLKNGAALPASQVVRTTARGGAPGTAPAITSANVPAISTTAPAGSEITFGANSVSVPQ